MSQPTAQPILQTALPEWTKSLPRQIALVAIGSFVLALSAQISVPMWPVPVTAQTLVVLALGFVYGPRLAGATVGTYLLEGAAGLPVFAGFSGGAAVLVGPTAGYLFGFLVAAILTGHLAERGWHGSFTMTAAGMVAGSLAIYAFGVAWLSGFVGFNAAVTGGVVPFLIGDAIKIAIAVIALPMLSSAVSSDK